MTEASEAHRSSPQSDGFDWSEGPQLELDQLLAQLVARAQDVMAAQGRLRGLLAANQMIIGDLELPVVLRRIAQAACRLVNARYAALGVLAPAGGLEQFIHVGVDQETVDRIGHLPTGKGLLGALIDDPHPIRLQRIADDPRSVGFPGEHPPMTSFLGVPIRVRDEVFGNLYLTESATGEFTADDEEMVTALAATAGVAIENARLFEQARKRQDWLQAATRITRQLLSDEGEEPLQLVARQVLQDRRRRHCHRGASHSGRGTVHGGGGRRGPRGGLRRHDLPGAATVSLSWCRRLADRCWSATSPISPPIVCICPSCCRWGR